MARTRPTVISPADVARALVQARDELGAARAALTLAKPTPAANTAHGHVKAACEFLDAVQAAIVEGWLRTTAESARVEGELLAERWAA